VADILGSCEEMADKCCLDELLDYINENCSAIMMLKDLKMEPNACSALFQKYLNTTPTEYIRQYRIEKGCQLLIQTNKSVAEISRECGMSFSYFSRRIREETGLTPLEYRRVYYRNKADKE
jgi:AraC-like DNA-binding protein